jgi:multiple sugar transport system permease protein
MATAATAKRAGRFGLGRKPKKVSTDVRHRIGERRITPYLFIAPHFIIFLLFVGYPFFLGFWLSLHNSSGSFDGPFVGARWYQQLFDPNSVQFDRFWTTVWNTILFVVMSTPILVAAGLFLANLLNSKIRGRNLFRGLYFAPWTLSVAVVGLTWWWMFNGNAGAVTLFFQNLFGGSPAWLSSNPYAWITILVATLWWTIGFNTIILLAGMQAIPLDPLRSGVHRRREPVAAVPAHHAAEPSTGPAARRHAPDPRVVPARRTAAADDGRRTAPGDHARAAPCVQHRVRGTP